MTDRDPTGPLPVPCPAALVPDTSSDTGVFNTAYAAAKAARAVYIGIERRGRGWTVKADTLTALPPHAVDAAVEQAIRHAAVLLVERGEIRADSGPGPVHYTLHGVADHARARVLAAALHTALYGDLTLLRCR
jgi:hypothetical protein